MGDEQQRENFSQLYRRLRNDSDYSIETRRLINQYFPFNNDLNEDFENSGPMRIEELSNVSPIVNESIIEKLLRLKQTKRVPLKKGKPIILQPTTQINDFINGEINYSMVPKENIILFQNQNNVTIERSLLNSTESSSIVYECKQIYSFYNFTENELKDKTPYFRLRKLGLFGVVPLDQIVSIIEGNNIIYHIIETPKKLVTVISHNVLYERGELVSASHCQDGQGETVYSIETVKPGKPVIPISESISQRTRKRTRENEENEMSTKKQNAGKAKKQTRRRHKKR